MKKLIKRFKKDNLSVAIFINDTDGKCFAKISKTYQTTDDKWHETTYYELEELLPMARLIAAVSKWVKEQQKKS